MQPFEHDQSWIGQKLASWVSFPCNQCCLSPFPDISDQEHNTSLWSSSSLTAKAENSPRWLRLRERWWIRLWRRKVAWRWRERRTAGLQSTALTILETDQRYWQKTRWHWLASLHSRRSLIAQNNLDSSDYQSYRRWISVQQVFCCQMAHKFLALLCVASSSHYTSRRERSKVERSGTKRRTAWAWRA